MKKKILLTGATGKMGIASVIELAKYKNEIEITLFVRETKQNIKKIKNIQKKYAFEIIWGDLKNYSDVKRAIAEKDTIIHMGALVSPMADLYPKLAWEVNYGGTKNIVDAIKELNLEKSMELIYIGTIAETGNREIPFHWGRVGDPIIPSKYDYYALSKIAAERYVIESGLEKWASLRQTGIIHENILEVRDGIEYHQPVNNHIEWVSVKDTGVLISKICALDIKKEFWKKVYNIGGGEAYRMTSFDFMQKIYDMVNIDIKEIYTPNMFATRNFHGHYFVDSDELNELFDFRHQSIDEVFNDIKENAPFDFKMLKYIPKKLIRHIVKKQSENNPKTPLCWIKNPVKYKLEIEAFFKSIDYWKKIKDWDDVLIEDDIDFKLLSHGYDENKDEKILDIDDMREAANFRGGQCLSLDMVKGDLYTKLKWSCSEGHEFYASPYLILKSGHWCEKCLENIWNSSNISMNNNFYNQLSNMDFK